MSGSRRPQDAAAASHLIDTKPPVGGGLDAPTSRRHSPAATPAAHDAKTGQRAAHKNGWKAVNAWAGYLVLGLPAVLAVPALFATLARFGAKDALVTGVPAAVWACTPALLWLKYTRRRPTSRRAAAAWTVLAITAVAAIAMSPIWFWSGPVLCVLCSELLRVATSLSRARWARRRAARPGSDKPSARSPR